MLLHAGWVVYSSFNVMFRGDSGFVADKHAYLRVCLSIIEHADQQAIPRELIGLGSDDGLHLSSQSQRRERSIAHWEQTRETYGTKARSLRFVGHDDVPCNELLPQKYFAYMFHGAIAACIEVRKPSRANNYQVGTGKLRRKIRNHLIASSFACLGNYKHLTAKYIEPEGKKKAHFMISKGT
jgi:hypothetical protein